MTDVQRREPAPPKKCWCGGDIVDDRCTNADPNEVGP